MGSKLPCELLTRQSTNQGLSALPMHPYLLNKLQTEAHLQSALLPNNITIEYIRANEMVLSSISELLMLEHNKEDRLVSNDISDSLVELN